MVVDGHTVFVSSANFTEAAQERNIEIGLLVKSPRLAEQITSHFNALTGAGLLQRIIRSHALGRQGGRCIEHCQLSETGSNSRT
ncbi:MAG: phospholipase D-like domain-containing protein [Planctomycetota bacterium]